MSRTVPVSFGTRNLWIYDQSLAVWLVRFIEHVATLDGGSAQPLARLVGDAPCHAALGAIQHLPLDEYVADENLGAFVTAAGEVSRQIRAAGPIPVDPLHAMRLDGYDLPPIVRAQSGTLDPEPIASVGDVLVALVRGELPLPPPHMWWYVGVEAEPLTIRMAGDLSG